MKHVFLNINKKIKQMDIRTKNIVFTAGSTYAGRFIQGLVVLITLPMARRIMNPEMFGIWLMISSLMGFMAFADLGISNCVLNETTKANATGDHPLMKKIVLSAYILTIILGLTLYSAWMCWFYFSAEPAKLLGSISQVNQKQATNALSTFFLLLSLNLPASLILRFQLGTQEGYLNGVNQICGAILTLIFMPVALYSKASVSGLIMASTGTAVLVNLMNSGIWIFRKKIIEVATWKESIDIDTMKSYLKTGFFFFCLQLAGAFAFQSDAIVISHTLGQASYGNFAVIQKLFLFVGMLLNTSIVGLWPSFGHAMALGNTRWLRSSLLRYTSILLFLGILLTSLLTLAVPWILEIWMHNTINYSFDLLLALAAFTVMEAIGNIYGSFMNAANILKIQIIVALLMAGTSFSLKLYLTPIFGPTGSVVSTLIAYVFISIPGTVLVTRRYFRLEGLKDAKL